MLAYLSRYTHRVAISNQRLLAFDERGVTFRDARHLSVRVCNISEGDDAHETLFAIDDRQASNLLPGHPFPNLGHIVVLEAPR